MGNDLNIFWQSIPVFPNISSRGNSFRLRTKSELSNVFDQSLLGDGITSVKCKGEWLPLGITVDSITGLTLTIDALAAQDIQTLQNWTLPTAKNVGATILVTDDADGAENGGR
jgi:hypothetical protein